MLFACWVSKTKITIPTLIDLEYNSMGDAGEKAVRDAVKDRSGFELML